MFATAIEIIIAPERLELECAPLKRFQMQVPIDNIKAIEYQVRHVSSLKFIETSLRAISESSEGVHVVISILVHSRRAPNVVHATCVS